MSITEFADAQRRMLDRFGIQAQSRYVEVPAIGGRAHVLTAGEGPAVLMLSGIGTPAAMWAPLMAHLPAHTLYALDLPGFGLTDPAPHLATDLRHGAVRFLEQVLDGLGLASPLVVANSMGSLWSTWLALDRRDRVAAFAHVGCPALILGTSAPLPMRILSVPPLARLLARLDPPSPRQLRRLAALVHVDLDAVPELADLLLATERLPGFEGSLHALLHTLVRLRGARPEVVLTPAQLGAVQRPVLLVWGDDDPFGSTAVAERATRAIPDATLQIVPGGHAPWIGEAARVGELVCGFLAART